MTRDWRDYTETWQKKIEEETAVQVRVLRLRAHVYYKIGWLETQDMIRHLLSEGKICCVPGESNWLTLPDYLDANSEFMFKTNQQIGDFALKKDIYDEWVRESPKLGYYWQNELTQMFKDAGHKSAKKRAFTYTTSKGKTESVELDIYCSKGKLKLGVSVKNTLSDVFINPNIIKRRPNNVYQQITREFQFCSHNGIVPILFAPLIDGSFYCFIDKHKGLFNQTLKQYFDPEHQKLCRDIKKGLNYSHVDVVTDKDRDRITEWIHQIPVRWSNRHCQ